MPDEPRTDVPDPGDLTERHVVPPYDPAGADASPTTDPSATAPTADPTTAAGPVEPATPVSPITPATPAADSYGARVEPYEAASHYTPASEPP